MALRRCYPILFLLFYLYGIHGELPATGSCTFEGGNGVDDNGLCGYTHVPLADDGDFFNWQLESGGGGQYMNVNINDHKAGQKARFYSPEIHQQDTHCFLFQYHMEGGIGGNTTESISILNVYVLDSDNSYLQNPVWKSSATAGRSGWTTVQLALNPRAYQVVFEAVVLKALPGIIALDNIQVSNEACNAAPHFLRVSDKEVNVGQNVSMQCLLWGYTVAELDDEKDGRTDLVMQKSNGDEFEPFSRKVYGDHLSAVFRFASVSLTATGKYRCVSRNATEVGVSNFALMTVKIPPVPQQPPEVMTLGSTHLNISLNTENYVGDEPIVQKILEYRTVRGTWSDGHHITTQSYHLWHLQPDTEYEIRVTLVRPGLGGAGVPGPSLITKTDCGIPLSPVQNVNLQPIASSKIKITWNEPDFRMTQCHFHSYVIKYRKFIPEDSTQPSVTPVLQYKTMSVDDGNVAVIPGLTPYTMYKIKVELANSQGSVETGDYTALTGEGVPGPIPKDSFQVINTNETSITLQWEQPNVTNGRLIRYEVAFRGLSSYQPDFIPQEEKGLFQIRAAELNVTLDNLKPGTNYKLSIRAQTEVGFGPAVEITAFTKIAPPKMPVYPPPDPDDQSTSTPTTIEIDILPAEANGAPISNYYIIIEEIPAEGLTEKPKANSDISANSVRTRSGKKKKKNKNRRDKRSTYLESEKSRNRRQVVVNTVDDSTPCNSKPLSFEESKKQNKPFYFGGQLSPGNVTEGTKFVVGRGSDSGGFTNPPLDPKKKYNIYVRVDSTVGNETKRNCALVAVKSLAPPETTTAAPTTTPTTVLVALNSVNNGIVDNSPSVSPLTPGDGDTGQYEDNEKVMLYASVGGGIAGFLILIVVVIVILLRYRKHNGKGKQKEEVVNPFEVRMMMSDMSGGGTGRSMGRSDDSPDRQALMMPDVVGFENPANRGMGYYFDKSAEAAGSSNAVPMYGSPATPIADERFALRVDDFHIHVNELKQRNNSGFHEEFATFHDGPTAPWTVGEREENRTKNRYGNIMAYDHSRVVLEPPKGQEDEMESDYINGNYVIGYKNPPMYIATQAPSAETINDFWLMIWQEKSSVIVMLTNLVELGKRKCHKYWPEESEQYGTIQVSLTETEELCDYTIRTFVVQQTGDYDVREIKQFHFTAWPDHGVPTRPTNILSFIRRVNTFEPPGQGPTTVHCSAGSGRTGCYIVIDMMLDMARDEGLVSIYNSVRDLRTRRVNMVQTEEQYIFIHESVLEALLCGDTLVSAPDLRQHYDDLITVDQHTQIAPVQEEFETLNVMTPKLTDEECSVARLPRNRQRNRFMDVLPADSKMPYLVTPDPTDPESNYINAVFVDSYSKRDAFLVTQMPLPNTVIDFWRLIYDYNCTSTIMMNDTTEHDRTCSQYWPDNGSAMFGPFMVELLRKEDEVDIITRLFKVQNVNRPSEGFRIVQQFQLTNWPATQPVPFTRNAVLRVIQLVTKWQDECSSSGEGRMLVHCVAGAGRSGTFIACYNMCTQLRQEYAVDVFNIVQRLRNVRPQLVETLEQYRFCYEVGWDFADQ